MNIPAHNKSWGEGGKNCFAHTSSLANTAHITFEIQKSNGYFKLIFVQVQNVQRENLC